METVVVRRSFASKKELAAWCADNGIQLAKPTTLKQGHFTIYPVVPEHDVSGMINRMTFKILGGEPPRYSHDGTRYVGHDKVDLTPEELERVDARNVRLNEIEALLFYNTRSVSAHYR